MRGERASEGVRITVMDHFTTAWLNSYSERTVVSSCLSRYNAFNAFSACKSAWKSVYYLHCKDEETR